jgi:2-oxoglutarate dehydrogenase complex dehydrogenase (E1) component-like enzyme
MYIPPTTIPQQPSSFIQSFITLYSHNNTTATHLSHPVIHLNLTLQQAAAAAAAPQHITNPKILTLFNNNPFPRRQPRQPRHRRHFSIILFF